MRDLVQNKWNRTNTTFTKKITISQFICLCLSPYSLPPPAISHLESLAEVTQVWHWSTCNSHSTLSPWKAKETLLLYYNATCWPKPTQSSRCPIRVCIVCHLCVMATVSCQRFSPAAPAVRSSVTFTLDFSMDFPLDVQRPLYLLCPKTPRSLHPVQSPHTSLFNTDLTAMTTWSQPSLSVFSFTAFKPSDIISKREWFEMNIKHCLFVADSSTCLVYSLAHSRLNIHQDNILWQFINRTRRSGTHSTHL